MGYKGSDSKKAYLPIYDVAVAGAGPSGVMAAIRAGKLNKKVILIERNNHICEKVLLTGKGRCNVTNIASIELFIERFGRQGQFLRSAFSTFFNQDLINFFEAKGLELKIERQGRVFPKTDRAVSIVDILRKYLYENNVKILYHSRITGIKKIDGIFYLSLQEGAEVRAIKVIVATGGVSYKETGSTGDGFRIANRLGHTVIPLKPGLVPLRTKELWVKYLQGLTLKNIRVTFKCGGSKLSSNTGELLFTHFGVSGPLVLDLSGAVVGLLNEDRNREVNLFIDLKPALTAEQIEKRLSREIETQGSKNIKNFLKSLLPLRLIPIFINLLKIEPDKKSNQLSSQERRSIVNLLKAFKLTTNGSLPLEEAMVTLGGISTKEINPRTMESRLVPGLYFAGEIIDASATSGGYNLQQAFSTGYLAGENAGKDA